jgi:hypothetical protein
MIVHIVETPEHKLIANYMQIVKKHLEIHSRLDSSPPRLFFLISESRAHYEALVFKQLAQSTVPVHRGDIVGPADRLAV